MIFGRVHVQDFQFLAKDSGNSHARKGANQVKRGGFVGMRRSEDTLDMMSEQRLPEQRLPEQRMPEQRLPEQRLPEQRMPEQRQVAAERRTQEAVSHLEDIKLHEIRKDVSAS